MLTPQELATGIRNSDDGRHTTKNTYFAGVSLSHERPAAICTLSVDVDAPKARAYLDFVVLPDKLPLGHAQTALWYLALAPLLEGQRVPTSIGINQSFSRRNEDLLEGFGLPFVSAHLGLLSEGDYLGILERLISVGGLYPFEPGCAAALAELEQSTMLTDTNGNRKINDPTPRVEALLLAAAAYHHFLQRREWDAKKHA